MNFPAYLLSLMGVALGHQIPTARGCSEGPLLPFTATFRVFQRLPQTGNPVLNCLPLYPYPVHAACCSATLPLPRGLPQQFLVAYATH